MQPSTFNKLFELFNIVVKNNNGEVTLKRNRIQGGIRKIRAVNFENKITITDDDKNDLDKWNNYCKQIREEIGVEQYCELVRNDFGDVIGGIVFYTKMGDEIKMKHFTDYNSLIQLVITKT